MYHKHSFSAIHSLWQKARLKDGRLVQARKITITSFFPSQREQIWEKIQTTESLRFICRPMLEFQPRSGYSFPTHWGEGDIARLRLLAYGLIPIGKHDIFLEKVDAQSYTIQSREQGDLVQLWDHLITMQAHEKGTTYTDEVVLYAGWLTLPIAWWSTQLYKHRQRRWQQLLRQG